MYNPSWLELIRKPLSDSEIAASVQPSRGVRSKHTRCGMCATNNEAEYKALLFALQKVKLLHGKTKTKTLSLDCYLDSELVVKQLSHRYKINDENIQKFFLQIWNLTIDFKDVKYTHIPREKNTEADRLANLALDEATRAQSRMF